MKLRSSVKFLIYPAHQFAWRIKEPAIRVKQNSVISAIRVKYKEHKRKKCGACPKKP